MLTVLGTQAEAEVQDLISVFCTPRSFTPQSQASRLPPLVPIEHHDKHAGGSALIEDGTMGPSASFQ